MRAFSLFLFLTFVTVPRLYAANCGGAVPCKCGDKVTQDYIMTEDLGPCIPHPRTAHRQWRHARR